MSRGVDVLAVLERAVCQSALIPDLSGELEQARAAVAELIEAAGKLRADVFLWRMTGNMPNLQMLANDEEDLDTALARVRGSA